MYYTPYGEKVKSASTGPDIFHQKYTGQVDDGDEAGLLYYNARYYDPKLGRFISADSLVPDPASTQSFNRYMYVCGNPVNFNDPSGYSAAEGPGAPGAGENGHQSAPSGPGDHGRGSEHEKNMAKSREKYGNGTGVTIRGERDLSKFSEHPGKEQGGLKAKAKKGYFSYSITLWSMEFFAYSFYEKKTVMSKAIMNVAVPQSEASIDSTDVDAAALHDLAQEGPQKWGQSIHNGLSSSVNNGNYMDINFSLGFITGCTFGIVIDNNQNLSMYFGGGFVTGPSYSVTWSPQSVTKGLNFGVQAQFSGLAVQTGYSINGALSLSNAFIEFGGGFGFGFSVMMFGVSTPLYNFNK